MAQGDKSRVVVNTLMNIQFLLAACYMLVLLCDGLVIWNVRGKGSALYSKGTALYYIVLYSKNIDEYSSSTKCRVS